MQRRLLGTFPATVLLLATVVTSLFLGAGSGGAVTPVGSIPGLGFGSQTGLIPLAGDWDGTGKSSVGGFVEGNWMLKGDNLPAPSAVYAHAFDWGMAADVPIVGDWDGNGTTTVGVFRNGTWYLKNGHGQGVPDVTFAWGEPGDIPIVGDWDGNGTDTIGVFRPLIWWDPNSWGQWFLRNSTSAGPPDVGFTWGLASDVPVVGDWDGNGTTTIGVYRAGRWYQRNTNNEGGVDASFAWGWAGDVPVVGDWDGNRSTTIGVRRDTRFFLRNANSGGAVDVELEWETPTLRVPTQEVPLRRTAAGVFSPLFNGSLISLPARTGCDFAPVTQPFVRVEGAPRETPPGTCSGRTAFDLSVAPPFDAGVLNTTVHPYPDGSLRVLVYVAYSRWRAKVYAWDLPPGYYTPPS